MKLTTLLTTDATASLSEALPSRAAAREYAKAEPEVREVIKEIIKEDPEVQSHTLSSHALPWIAGISIRRSNNLRISCIDGALMRVNSLHSFCDLISGEGFLKSLASEFT